MRLFFGLTFSKEDKIALARVSGSIDPYVTKGKAVREDNYHLTLSFIGEVEQKYLDVFCSILDRNESALPHVEDEKPRALRFPAKQHPLSSSRAR
ncbi:MAG: 2'-5' RNA ligase family protein [Sphaerochaeta sp.]